MGADQEQMRDASAWDGKFIFPIPEIAIIDPKAAAPRLLLRRAKPLKRILLATGTRGGNQKNRSAIQDQPSNTARPVGPQRTAPPLFHQ